MKQKQTFFEVSWGPDGAYATGYTEEEMQERLDDIVQDYEGDIEAVGIKSKLPDDIEFGEGRVFIRGEIVVPKLVSVVKKMEF